jgi:predicted transport protein
MFEELRKRTLNIDSSVSEEVLKLYIAYKNPNDFLDVIPQKGRLKLSLSIDIDLLDDPKEWARDVRDVGHWGNGDVEFTVASPDDLEYAMTLVRQAYAAQSDPVDG